jgi:hypothetical protein
MRIESEAPALLSILFSFYSILNPVSSILHLAFSI